MWPESPFRYQYGSTDQHIQLLRALQTVSISRTNQNDDDGAILPSNSSIVSQQIRGSSSDHGHHGAGKSSTTMIPPTVPLSQAARLAASLAEALDWPSEFGHRLQQMGAHYRHLPYRLGHSKALDAAVTCVLASYNLVSHGLPHDESVELANYGVAIRALREELSLADHPATTSSETLCAALIIAQYELLKPGQSSYSYVTLAGGVSAIFRGSGPGRIQSDFELAIFSSQYPAIITQALLRGEDCFLGDPDWAGVMRRGVPSDTPVLTESWTAIARLPNLLIRMRSIMSSEPGICDTSSPLYPSILRDAYALRKEIVKHSDTVTRLLSHPGVHEVCANVYKGPLPPTQEWNPTTKNESLFPHRIVKQTSMYHAWVITVNVVLSRLLPDENAALTLQTAQAARHIMATLDFVSATKPFGAMYMTYAGPMVYGVSGASERMTLLEKMTDLFRHFRMHFDHASMMTVFEAVTGGPVLTGSASVFAKGSGTNSTSSPASSISTGQ
ncbi:hypothetical protein H2204_012994 [Knufia peltigerae]|uniref:Uncharacterized protein n=1 Tax=Knufia peltigerae TaxID=1002370 RepID=A0AA39CRT1_9EURO|nr:hypothetical protein H2204_012994 [Knufia peltigerae]